MAREGFITLFCWRNGDFKDDAIFSESAFRNKTHQSVKYCSIFILEKKITSLLERSLFCLTMITKTHGGFMLICKHMFIISNTLKNRDEYITTPVQFNVQIFIIPFKICTVLFLLLVQNNHIFRCQSNNMQHYTLYFHYSPIHHNIHF